MCSFHPLAFVMRMLKLPLHAPFAHLFLVFANDCPTALLSRIGLMPYELEMIALTVGLPTRLSLADSIC